MGTPVAAYIDGFNLYHGLHQLSGRRDLWLDVAGMIRSTFLRTGEDLAAVHYFTAAVIGPGQPRQDTYLRALKAHAPEIAVHLGHYMRKTAQCRICHATWSTYEEKESDVALAVQIVQDAGLHRYERTLIISADSDMCPAIRAAKVVSPDQQITAIFPPRRSSMAIKKTADTTLRIFDKVPRRHQLPTMVAATDGSSYSRPPYWR